MKYSLQIIGLCSIAALLVSCSSIKDAPGYRVSHADNHSQFSRSESIKSASYHKDEQVTELTSADSAPFNKFASSEKSPSDYAALSDKRESGTGQHTSTPDQSDDVELIIGKHKYYKSVDKKKNRGNNSKGVSLSFERASIREVIKVVLGDIMQVNYTVEPGIDGEVTINTSKPIAKNNLIPTLESMLQVHGAVLYKDQEGIYRISPRTAVKGRGFVPETSKKLPVGYGIKIVPLKYIPAAEMQKILEPLANPDAFVRVDPNRNLLVLAGTSSELENLLQTIDTFDVDVLQGMSVGLYQIHNVEAQIVAKNLDALFGESGNSPMAGMIKIMPIEHLNSLMIISASPDYLKEMKDWVDRFDQVRATEGQQLYVYHVQHGEAEHLAGMLNQIFAGQGGKSRKKSGSAVSSLAPNVKPATISSDGSDISGNRPQKTILNNSGGEGLSITPDDSVRIVADKENNSIMIMANAKMYEQMKSALKRIDIPPMQVLVEATIMEVSLSDNLEYGVQWYFKNGLPGNKTGGGGIDLDGLPGIASSIAGFSYSIVNASTQVTAMLNALAKDSQLKVISSPSILVLDNQSAEIRVGDQQPIFTGSSTTEGGVITQNIQFKDTGVSLRVTPRVNSNGMVTMDLAQEVTDVGEIDQATGQRSFLQRNIKSNISVKSGETIVLGGLIKDNSTSSRQGAPVVSKLPVVGNLFSGTRKQSARTELLVLITPTAVKNQKDLYKTGEELRSKMKRLLNSREIMGMQ
ncbi:MAG: type II secretion system secretin GspD [bacterium]